MKANLHTTHRELQLSLIVSGTNVQLNCHNIQGVFGEFLLTAPLNFASEQLYGNTCNMISAYVSSKNMHIWSSEKRVMHFLYHNNVGPRIGVKQTTWIFQALSHRTFDFLLFNPPYFNKCHSN